MRIIMTNLSFYRSLFVTLFFLLSVKGVYAQTFLEGRVVSQSEPNGVAGALVYLRGTNYGASTDSVGVFRFSYKGRLAG